MEWRYLYHTELIVRGYARLRFQIRTSDNNFVIYEGSRDDPPKDWPIAWSIELRGLIRAIFAAKKITMNGVIDWERK
jgi:hypothetical protein